RRADGQAGVRVPVCGLIAIARMDLPARSVLEHQKAAVLARLAEQVTAAKRGVLIRARRRRRRRRRLLREPQLVLGAVLIADVNGVLLDREGDRTADDDVDGAMRDG